MSSSESAPRKFKIEGSGQMLEALAQAIELALRAARVTPDRTGAGSIARGAITIEVEAINSEPDHLRYVIASIDDAVSTVTGWAETKRCDECEEPVALLFDDAYLETRNGEGVICCECYRRTEDGEEEET
jgi:formylmethanofuran dehydrogenase subunit E